MKRAWLWLVACLMAPLPALASEPIQLVASSYMEVDGQLVSARGRPNEEWRLNGLKSYLGGHYREAIDRFEKASSYADKFSQHYLSLIYWYGQGVETDPIVAYIWSDLAAERGDRRLLAIREKIWGQLNSEQRSRAVSLGAEYYARFGDEVAKPRAEAELRRFARAMTGSRVGYRNQMMESGGGPVNGAFAVQTGSNAAAYAISVAGSPDELYGSEGGIKRLETYWKEQDALLAGQKGRVEIGRLERKK